MRQHLQLLALVPLVSCSDGNAVSTDAGTCACKAIQTSFDKGTSTLGATNVQDAIDELAARPVAEAPIGSRIRTIDKVFPNPGTHGGVGQKLSCADPVHDLAIGGACGFVDNAELVETTIENDATRASYGCSWLQRDGSTSSMRVTVVCLTGAR